MHECILSAELRPNKLGFLGTTQRLGDSNVYALAQQIKEPR